MKQITYIITDELGIHARPAGLLVKACGAFQSAVKLTNGAKSADAKRIMGVMAMGVKRGDTITMSFDGPDEDDAAAKLAQFLRETL